MSGISDQVLPKPPRLISDTTGYDWREFDRWLQRLYSLLGMPQSSALNLISAAQETLNLTVDSGANFALDHQHEIKTLEKRLESLIVEMNMIIDHKQDIQNVLQMIQNMQVKQDMGA